MTPAEGRLFEREGEALVGADVAFTVGDAVTPAHAMAGERRIGEECEEESRHRHKGVRYTVVGRLPPLGTAWDPIGNRLIMSGPRAQADDELAFRMIDGRKRRY